MEEDNFRSQVKQALGKKTLVYGTLVLRNKASSSLPRAYHPHPDFRIPESADVFSDTRREFCCSNEKCEPIFGSVFVPCKAKLILNKYLSCYGLFRMRDGLFGF
jgi:hypothetical protein